MHKIVCSLLCLLGILSCTKPERSLNLELKHSEEIHFETSKYYLSFALDWAQIAGGKWWEGSMDFAAGRGGIRAIPFVFDRPKFIELSKNLQPFILRLGGSESDSLFYDINDQYKDEPLPKGFQTRLSKKIWDDIFAYKKKMDMKILMVLNVGPGYRDKEKKLNIKPIEDFLKSSSEKGYQIDYFEIGNEINAFFLNYGWSGQIFAKQYVKEYLELKQRIKSYYPKAKVMGPANAWWPYINEPFAFFTASTEKIAEKLQADLEVLSWHYYPSQSQRCPVQLVAANQKNMASRNVWMKIDKAQNKVHKIAKNNNIQEIWLTETGPAQCGGEPGVSDHFYSALWFANHLAYAAFNQNKVLIRQTLSGSDYGLLNDNTMQKNPDYYIALTWKNLISNKVLKTGMETEGLYAFCQKGAPHVIYLFVGDKDRDVNITLKEASEVLIIDSNNYYKDLKFSPYNKKILSTNNKSIYFIRNKKQSQLCA
tara:strand:- start:7917 stop:9359 length:1443 start_codon:yes stop_codon:yes gene_type:complete